MLNLGNEAYFEVVIVKKCEYAAREHELKAKTDDICVVVQTPRVHTITTIFADKNGEVVKSSSRAVRSKNGSGFVISYTEKMCEFLQECTIGSVVRVFVYIAHNQNYGTDGKTFGWRASHKYLRNVLHISKPTLWAALDYLKEHFLLHVGKIEGYNEFMINPDYVTIGQDKKARRAEWNRRWSVTLKKEAQRREFLAQHERELLGGGAGAAN